MKLLGEKQMSEVKLLMGGVIPPIDVDELNKIGVHVVFTPGTRREVMLSRIAAILK